MDELIIILKSTTFAGRRLTRKQLAMVQETVEMFPRLSLRELGRTVCENLKRFTPKGDYKTQPCLKLRILSTILIIMFVFRLVQSTQRKGYGITLNELWESCRALNVELPQDHPASAAAICTDAKAGAAKDLSELYHMGWSIEGMYKTGKSEVGIEDSHSRNENGVKQEIYAQFTHMTLVRQLTKRGEQHLNTDRSGEQLQASFRNSFMALQQHIEMLALKVSASLADKLTDILKTTTISLRRIRPFRSYPRKSHRPRSKRGLKRGRNQVLTGYD